MPRPLVKPKEEAPPGSTATPHAPPAPEPQTAAGLSAASASASVDVSTIFALYKKCIEDGYQNCDVLRQMGEKAIKERLKSAIESELMNIITPELRGQIGQICIEV
jgi:hypothetical protein